ncbi:MAG: type II toxin-antitoxin system HicA family toxin [Patescibacteria group bacterium]
MDTKKITNIYKETSALVWKEANLFMAKSLIVIVPNHKQIAHGTLESILKQSDMSYLEFESYYK